MSLEEIDFLELAYTYLDYINNHIGYGRCEKCGRMIKHSKTKPRKYCEECGKDVERENNRDRVRRYRERCHTTK